MQILASGLGAAAMGDLVQLAGGALGIVEELRDLITTIALLDSAPPPRAGEELRRLGPPRIPVGPRTRGRIIDPLGRPIDGLGPISGPERRLTASDPSSFADRQEPMASLFTGVKAVDLGHPLRRGNSVLIGGASGCGKTRLALDMILGQRDTDLDHAIFVLVGDRRQLATTADILKSNDVWEKTSLVFAPSSAPPDLKLLGPSAGLAIAEEVLESGGHALLILDDLERLIAAYQARSLRRRRWSAGRFVPDGLLNFTGALFDRARARETGSLTVIGLLEFETDPGDKLWASLGAQVDRRFAFEPELLRRGQRPALFPTLGFFQPWAAPLRLTYLSHIGLAIHDFDDLKRCERFAELDATARDKIARGARTWDFLDQAPGDPRSLAEMVALIAWWSSPHFNQGEVKADEDRIRQALRSRPPPCLQRLDIETSLPQEDRQPLFDWIASVLGR